MNNGLPFMALSLSMLGAFITLGGIAFALSAMDSGKPSPRLTGLWRCVAECHWSRLVGEMLKMSLAWLDRVVLTLFEDADKKPLLNILYLGLLIVFIPLAAVINALLGGSPLLFKAYLTGLGMIAILAVTSQLNRSNRMIAVLNAALSFVAGVGLFLGAPLYVLISFTERISHENIGHAFLISLLIAPFYYVAAFSTKNYVELFIGRDPTTRRSPAVLFFRRFLAALPVAFVLVFLALLLGQLAVKQAVPVRTTQMLFVSITISAFSLPSAMCALSPIFLRGGLSGSLPSLLNGLVIAMGLSIALLFYSYVSTPHELSLAASVNVLFGLDAGGKRVFLGPDFWVMHIPFLPVLGVLAFCLIGTVAKLLAYSQALVSRPGVATAGLLCAIGSGLFLFGRWLV